LKLYFEVFNSKRVVTPMRGNPSYNILCPKDKSEKRQHCDH
jgi:hypothetical protein